MNRIVSYTSHSWSFHYTQLLRHCARLSMIPKLKYKFKTIRMIERRQCTSIASEAPSCKHTITQNEDHSKIVFTTKSITVCTETARNGVKQRSIQYHGFQCVIVSAYNLNWCCIELYSVEDNITVKLVLLGAHVLVFISL